MDAATLQVWISRLTGVADEMGAVLRRAAYSPNIKERADCSCALFTPDGTLARAGRAHSGAPRVRCRRRSAPRSTRAATRSGPMSRSSSTTRSRAGRTSTTSRSSRPSSAPARLHGWVANRAHHADVGGMAPGSMPPDATEIYQEGLRIPPVRWTHEVEALFLAASRTPDERRGDLDAQRGANRLGRDAAALSSRRPPDVLDEIVAYGERRMRAALEVAARRHLRVRGRARLDRRARRRGPGAHRGAGDRRRRRGDVRLRGHRRATPGFGRTRSRPSPSSAVAFALRSVVDPDLPANGGALRPVHVRRARGLDRRRATAGRGRCRATSRSASASPTCVSARSRRRRRDRVGAASQGTMNNVLIGGRGLRVLRDDRRRTGRPPRTASRHERCAHRDDQHARHAGRGVGARVSDARAPVRVAQGSGGAGAAPGGDGIVREIEMLDRRDALARDGAPRVATVGARRRRTRAHGARTGCCPAATRRAPNASPDKSTRAPAAGDVVRILTPGGGGWNRPA